MGNHAAVITPRFKRTHRFVYRVGGPVSRDALIKRISRHLLREDIVVRVSRSQKAKIELGDYYLLDVRMNAIVGRDIDLEELGRDLGVLSSNEHPELD